MLIDRSEQNTREAGHLDGSPLRSMVSSLVGPKEPAPPPQPVMGFFTDTSLCIGCKACEVACKQWNQLPAKDPFWTGSSYDNTGHLSAIAWRHVQFIEEIGQTRPALPLIEEQITPFTSHKRGIAFQLPQGGIAEREQLHKNDETWDPARGTDNSEFQIAKARSNGTI